MSKDHEAVSWLANLHPMDMPVLTNPFQPTCLEWKRQRPPRPIRGRISKMIAHVVEAHWQIFSEEFQETWEQRAENDLARETCVKWQPAKIRRKPFNGSVIEWGEGAALESDDE